MDIFNFSRAPKGEYPEILEDVKNGIYMRALSKNLLQDAALVLLKPNNQEVISYARVKNNKIIVVIANIDEEKANTSKVKISKMKKNSSIVPIKAKKEAAIDGKNLLVTLEPCEIQVYLITIK